MHLWHVRDDQVIHFEKSFFESSNILLFLKVGVRKQSLCKVALTELSGHNSAVSIKYSEEADAVAVDVLVADVCVFH
jgi:hypothetical protein